MAYFVVNGQKWPTPAALRTWLSQRLPEPMLPTACVQLASLPVGLQGKVDYAALSSQAALNGGPSTPIAPEGGCPYRTPLESRVAEIIASLLELESVAPDDNFFLLGGHSLLGAQLIARLRDAFGVSLTLRTVFDSPTAAELAEAVDRGQTRATRSA